MSLAEPESGPDFTRIIANVTTQKARPRTARNSIRIIGGVWRGRRIPFPDVPGLRPTPDRVRETLFNWVQPLLHGARCLDLFAGSGALGLEALSRGAGETLFVDQSPLVAENLREQLERLGARNAASVHCRRAEAFLREPAAPFDLVFLDPPFHGNLLPGIVELLVAGGWLVPGAHLYLEGERTAEPPLPAGWQLLKSKLAGEVGYHLTRSSR
ncbi:MAG: 16S rRNA (guanine(966)-N(2))-methyltransferase RsmD [Steroidobacteraceae bacterium]|nr:16S rRNA (guanine(966)-N(2))-methyltransferase RsmD [Steroidobacteraceae bacterium]